jgi:uncharacterized cupredoxin-like copper-binding protein
MMRQERHDMPIKTVVASLSVAAAIAATSMVLGTRFTISALAHGEHRAHAFAAGEPGDPKKAFRVVEVVMTDGPGKMGYAPDRVEVKRGEQIKFVLTNAGAVDHEFLIDSFANNAKHKKDMEKAPEMTHDEPNGARLKPNTRTELLWRFSKAGTFEFACLIPGHYETGMKGVLIVK